MERRTSRSGPLSDDEPPLPGFLIMKVDRNGLLRLTRKEKRLLASDKDGSFAKRLQGAAKPILNRYSDQHSRRAGRNPTRDPANVHPLSARPQATGSVP